MTEGAPPRRPRPGDGARRAAEGLLFGGRWLLVPFFALLLAGLLLLLAKSVGELAAIAGALAGRGERDVLLGVLSLVDSALVASLVVVVVVAGYENFVARVEPEDHPDWPRGMAAIDYAGLKQKLMGSVVAISAVKLLELFVHLGGGAGRAPPADREVGWAIALHLTLVLSALALALIDRIGGKAK